MRTIADEIKSLKGNGSKAATCVRCKGEIQPYAGRRVAVYRETYAHHPGQCADAGDRKASVRGLADQPGLFVWSCTYIEPAGDIPAICDEISDDRGAYLEHFRQHGATQLRPSVAPIKLRKSVPAAKRQVPAVPAFKRIAWTTTEHFPTGENHPAELGGGPVYAPVTTEHRGQFWANGPDAHSVIVIEDRRAAGLPNQLVTLYLDANGQLSANWSDASVSRREANRRARDHKRYAAA